MRTTPSTFPDATLPMNRRFTLPTLLFTAGLVAMIILISRANSDIKPAAPRQAKPASVRNLPKPKARAKPKPTASPARTTASTTWRRPVLPAGLRSVAAVVDSFTAVAKSRYGTACRNSGIPWPPERLMLVAFKRERVLEVWGAGVTGAYHRIGKHTILGASGGPGPKRRQGDRQVPEGFYNLTELNPNSIAHLSFRVDYPNATDIANSGLKREEMGGDIYVHGHWLSFGCLAIGDRAIEELFTLTAQVKPGNRRIIIAPFDFRRNARAPYPREERWVHTLYDRIKQELRAFPAW